MVQDLLRHAVRNCLAAVGVLYREIEQLLVDGLRIHAPGSRRISEGSLKRYELREIVVVQRVGLAEVATWGQLVEPDLPGRRTLLEEQHDRLHTSAYEGPARA